MAFGVCLFATEARLSSNQNPNNRSPATSPSSSEPLPISTPAGLSLMARFAVPEGASFSFDALLQRIHPAASRVRRLSGTPAIYVAFDLLAAEDGRSCST